MATTLRYGLALALAFLAQNACAQATEMRPPQRGVSAVRIANYGSPSVLLERREQVSPVVSELNALRSRSWRRGDTRLSCYSTLLLLTGKKTTGQYRITPDTIVQRPPPGEKGASSHSLEIGRADLPVISKLLSEITPAKCH